MAAYTLSTLTANANTYYKGVERDGFVYVPTFLGVDKYTLAGVFVSSISLAPYAASGGIVSLSLDRKSVV